MSEVVELIDRYFWVILLVFGSAFTGLCIYIFSASVNATKFEDVYSAEKLQLLASLDPNAKKDKKQNAAKAKKNKKAKKPKDGKEEPSQQQNVNAEANELEQEQQPEPEPVPIQAEPNASPEESDGSSKPSTSTDTVATSASKKKKQNKKAKPAAKKQNPEPVEPTPESVSNIESVSEPIHVIVAEASLQQSAPPKKEKTRTKRAAQREDITDIDEDKFLNRLTASDLEPEYIDFISQFVGRANADKYDVDGIREQVVKLQSKLNESEKTISTKDKDLAKIKNELVTARNGIHDMHKLEKTVLDEKANSDNLRKQLELTESSLRAALAKADNKEEVNKLKAKIAELDAALQASAATKAHVQKLEAELKAAKSAATADKALNDKLAEFQKLADAAAATKALDERQISELRAENANLNAQLFKVNAELETLNFEVDGISRGFVEKENLVQANNDYSEELKKNIAKIEDLTTQNKNKDGAITKLNHELRKAYNDSREALGQLEEVKKNLATSQETEVSLKARLDVNEKKLADFEEYYRETSSRIRELQSEIQSLEHEKNDLKLQLREERERVEQLEKVETVTPATSAPPVEDTAAKEQIEKLEKELETAQKKVTELESAQKESSAKTPEIEKEISELKAKKNEVVANNVKLAVAVREAEAQAKKIAAEAAETTTTTLKTVAETFGEALSSAGIKTNPNVPSSVEGLQKWVQSVAGAVKKATSKPKEATPAPEAPKATTSAESSDEVEELKEQIADYEKSLATLIKQIGAIEHAYNEQKHEQKELAALQKQSKQRSAAPASDAAHQADSDEWELVH